MKKKLWLLSLVISLRATTNAYAQERVTPKATPKTVAWGYYDAKAAPVLHVKPGETGEIGT